MSEQNQAQFPSIPTGQPQPGQGTEPQVDGNTTPPVEPTLNEIRDGMSPKQFRALQSMFSKAVAQGAQQAIEQLMGSTTVNQATPVQQAATPANQPVNQQVPDPITAEALRIVAKEGVTFEPGDPELSQINSHAETALEYLQSVKAAAEAKARRIQPATGNPAAVPGAIGSGTSVANRTLAEQFEADKAKLTQKFRGPEYAKQYQDLRIAYRKKGLGGI